ncbi:hypothetical protein L1049_008581 [Liquidambar formosana]|uniref:PGG domain-containing protein n=1 Tax=Liquidambar formosana TaxID=63359 RepID=A0AAP0S4I1_LIQFO
MKEISNGILVMASLLATMSCGVALNPPGGYWQDWDLNFNTTLTSNSTAVHKPGHAILYDLAHKRFSWFLFFDIQVFLAALSIILALLSPTPLKLDSLKYLYIRNASFYMVIISIVIIFQAVAFTTKDQFFAAPIYCLFNIIWLVIIQYFALWSEFCKFSV